MEGVILVLMPAILISLGVLTIRLKFCSLISDFLKCGLLIKLVSILILSVFSTFAVDYVYCSTVQVQCEPGALTNIGYFFHALFVFFMSITFEYVFTIFLGKYFKDRK